MVNVKNRVRRAAEDRNVRKSGFVYKPRSSEDVKRRASRTGGRFDSPFKPGFDVWRPKQGDNCIRILPPTWEDFNHFGYTVWLHGYVGDGSYLCRYKMLNKKCPICAAAKEAKESGDADEAKALTATEKVVLWILDRGENEDKPQIFMISWTMDRDITALSINNRTGKVLLIDHDEQGYDLSFKRTGQGLNTRYFGQVFDRDPTPIHPDEKVQEEVLTYIQDNPIPETLHYHSVEHMEAVLAGGVEEKDEDLDEAESQDEDEEEEGRDVKARSRQEGREARQFTRRKAEEEEEDTDDEDADAKHDEEIEQEEDDERDYVEERPRKQRRAKAAEEEDEDADADEEAGGAEEEDREEEEERIPARRARTTNGRRRVKDEDEDMDERPARRPLKVRSVTKVRRASQRG